MGHVRNPAERGGAPPGERGLLSNAALNADSDSRGLSVE